MFNDKGLVIGAVVSGITDAEGMNFAIPSTTVMQFISDAQNAKTWDNEAKEKVKAKAPCPKCGSWNTDVENGIFYCNDCGFEGG